MSTAASRPRSKLPPLIVMGVSGCGKSSVGEALAARFAVPYIEGDAMHPPANIAKMSAGTPLNDDDRWPWLDALAARLKAEAAQNGGTVASCSSLKKIYRDRLQAGSGPQTRFIFLDCSRKTLERNQSARTGHFMPPSLLDSQLATLEPPYDETRAIVIDGNQPFDAVIQSIVAKLEREPEMADSKVSVAVIGAGIMGSAIATRLIERGLDVRVFDLDKDKIAALVAKGAKASATVASATRDSNFIILSLNHANIVRAVVFGNDGVASAATPEKLLIDMSSIDPGDTRKMAEKLGSETGMKWVDCPLSGGVPSALEGRLTIMAGGDPADFERARTVMQHLSANYTLMGQNGAGQTVKLINQLFCAVQFQAVAEAVKLAEAGGVDASAIPAALKGGRADSAIMQEFMTKFAKRDYTPTGRIDNMMKDLDSLQSFALSTRTPLPMTGQLVEIHRLLCAAGLGAKDSAEMMRLLDGDLS